MSHLTDLINQLRPDGVEYRKLGEIGKFYGGLTGKNKKDFNPEIANRRMITYKNIYNNPAIDFINGYDGEMVYIGDGEKQNIAEVGDIFFTGSSETPDECGFSSVLTADPMDDLYLNSFCFGFRLNNPSILLPDFCKHLFRSYELRKQISRTASGVTRFNVSKARMAKVSIPIPPLPIQAEIVRILDSFTELQTELQTELTLRQKQYEYYRNRLLTFDPDDPAVEWITISNLCNIRNGYTPSKSNKSYWTGNDATIPWFRMDDIRANGHILSDSLQHITPAAVKGKLFPANSIILATTATIGEHALITADSLANQQFTYLTIREPHKSLVDPKYFYYYMYKVDEWCKSHVKQSSFPAVDMTALRKLEIPIPPLSTQQRIVNILDKFSDYTTSLTNGLPAEIKLRQQQYEYYRDKLLSFRRASAA